MPYACSVVEDEPTNPWAKLHNGLWDPSTGILRGCDGPAGSKRTYNAKLKMLNGMPPVLKDKCEADIKNGVDPMLSFIMAKIACDEHTKMLSDRQQEIDEEKQRKKDALDCMKFAENTRGTGLNSMAASDGDTLAPPKTSTHITNLKTNEDDSTIASLIAKCGN